MSEKLYFVGLTSVSEFLVSHEKDKPLFYSIGRQEIGGVHGIIREKWTVCLSDIQNGICRYYLQTIGYTDKINGEPFNREIFDSCRSRAENLREQIKSSKSKYNLVRGCVSFPKDLILLEGSEIEYSAKNNRFHFEENKN
ncbi:MAG: hypothetical protein M3367_06915 [Acidobacteriota bacterium]|nr:hypothetical protein [Acidobacteriota bacterium]